MIEPDYPLASSTWGDEEKVAIQKVIDSGEYTMGSKVKEFEAAFADYIGVKYALMVNSGSSANLVLIAALKYMSGSGLSEGDEIIVPAVSWSTTFYPVHQLGFRLVFVDVDADSLNIDVSKIEEAITEKTKAIFAVNLLGNPCDFTALREICERHNLFLIEDNCESLGADYNGEKTGSIGLAGTHSFFYSHHICTMEGGMVTTNDRKLYEAMHSLRAHGWIRGLPRENSVYNHSPIDWENSFRFVLPGYNLRPLEIEGAAGIEQLKKLDSFVEQRKLNAEYFIKKSESCPYIRVQNAVKGSSWFGFSIVLQNELSALRTEFVEHLTSAGIESRPIVAGNFLKNPVIDLLNHSVSGEIQAAQEIELSGLFVGNQHFPLIESIDHFFNVTVKFYNQCVEGRVH
jgi:CDP-4-dehydro-6-deoxyglucose reductase, E1